MAAKNVQTSDNGDDPVDKYAPMIVRGAIIGTGLLGIAVFARSIRLFTTFQHARQIPDEFFRKQTVLRGTVAHIGDNGQLRIQHIPIFKAPFSKYFRNVSKEQGKLSVYAAGVELTEPGLEWLKKNLLWRPVWLTLIRRYDENSLECEILSKKGRFFKYNVNKELIRLGLGRVPGLDAEKHVFAFKTNAAYSRLIHDLIISEKYADRRGVGMWHRTRWFESYLSYLSQNRETFVNSFLYRILTTIVEFSKRTLTTASRTTRLAAAKSLQMAKQVAGSDRN